MAIVRELAKRKIFKLSPTQRAMLKLQVEASAPCIINRLHREGITVAVAKDRLVWEQDKNWLPEGWTRVSERDGDIRWVGK